MSLKHGMALAGLGPAWAIVALLAAGPAGAQESLDTGKSGAQLFASDCAVCHKNPQTLARSGGVFGLSNFLREHYTASRESAGAIAAYLESVGRAPAANRPSATKRTAKGDDKSKGAEKKQTTPKSGDAKSSKPDDAKTSEPKTSEPKSSEPMSSGPKMPELKTNDILAPERRSPVAPAAKPETPEKSD